MAHDIFISYSSKDKNVADAIVAAMEQEDIRCWYAPRDVKPGGDWGDEIAKAISNSKVFLLIFSGNANHSQRVLDELNLAITKESTILPFRIENMDPVGAMQLHLSTRHWIDAFVPSWEKHIEKLVRAVKMNLEGEELEEIFDDLGVTKHKKKKTRWMIPVAATIALGLGLVFGIPKLREIAETPTPTQAEAKTTSVSELKDTPTAEPTEIPLGSAENPIVWTFAVHPSVPYAEIKPASEAVAERFTEAYDGMVMKAIPSPSISAAYDAICVGEAHLAYLDSFTYLRSDEEDCDIESRMLWYSYSDIEYGGAIYLSNKHKGTESISELEGTILCIPSRTSISAWVLPSLELRTQGTALDAFFGEIRELGDHSEVIRSLYRGECDVGTAFYDARSNTDLPNVMDRVELFITTSRVPQTNMSFRTDIESSLITSLIAFLNSDSKEYNDLAFINGKTSEIVDEELIEINDSFFNDIRDLLERAGAKASEFSPPY